MTPAEASKLLDMAKEGQDVPQMATTLALTLTRDLSTLEVPPLEELEEFMDALRRVGLL